MNRRVQIMILGVHLIKYNNNHKILGHHFKIQLYKILIQMFGVIKQCKLKIKIKIKQINNNSN